MRCARSEMRSPGTTACVLCLWPLRSDMLTAVVLLVLSGVMAHAVDTCLEHFECHWEGDVFVLHCEPTNDSLTSKMSVGTITDLPVSATRLKIVCDHQHGEMQLAFDNLYNIMELTLDCIDVTANGSNIFQGISNISRLVLRNLYWESIQYDCFKSLTSLRSLTLDHLDRLEYIHPGALNPLVSLESLSFLHIALPYGDYTTVLGGMVSSSFQTLALHGIQSPDPGVDIRILFGNWTQRAILKNLDMGNNKYSTISLIQAGLHLPQLEHLSLRGNLVAETPFESALSVSLIVSHERLKTVYVTGFKSSTPNLSVRPLCAISVSTNVSSLYHPTMPIPPVEVGTKMESISFNGAMFLVENIILPKWLMDLEFPEGGYGIQINDSTNVLKYIDVSNFHSSTCITIAFIGFHGVKYFNMQNVRSIDPEIFKEMFNVTVLLLGNNDLDFVVKNDIENVLFSENKHLKVLDLAGCHLTEIPKDEFSNLQYLQHLNLSRNSLEEFRVELNMLNKFRFLNLSGNKLNTLSVATRVQLDKVAADRNVHIDISRNPLKCTCNDTEFVSWVQTSRVIFQNKHQTFCADSKTNLLLLFRIDIDELELDCNPDRYENDTIGPHTEPTIDNHRGPNTEPTIDNHKDNLFVVILLPATIVFAFISVSLYLVYRYRWKCAIAWNSLTKYTRFTDVHLDEVAYERDAFICYNSGDSGWVCHDLLDHLDSCGISTVIHHRDFLPGSVLEETIRESIDKSRFTVLVLSPDFLTSNWCQLEMHIARNRIISEGRDVIVPIILREFPASLVTRTLEGILSKSYLQWTNDPDGQALFWDKLTTKLKRGGNLRPLEC